MAQSWHCASTTFHLRFFQTRSFRARAFLNPVTIVTSTLLGVISQHSLRIEGNTEGWKFESVLVAQTRSIAKVNGLAAYGDSVAVGGLTADGKGAAEVYQYEVV
jgi:hypothetical protein